MWTAAHEHLRLALSAQSEAISRALRRNEEHLWLGARDLGAVIASDGF